MPNIKRISSIALLSALSLQAHAAKFEFDNFTVEWDNVLSAGVQYRIQERKTRISQGKSGANGDMDNLSGIIDNAFIINSNDGNNNFDRGFTVQRISLLSDVDFNFGDWGVFARAKWWHDFMFDRKTDMTEQAWRENNANPVFGDNNGYNATFGHHNPAATNYGQSSTQMMDFFWYGDLTLPNDHPISLRIGRQVISWGEAMLSGGSLATGINHVDAHIRNQPGFDLKELFLPTTAIYLQTDITFNLGLEAYYQTEWNPVVLDPSGTYFSEFDSIGAGGNTFIFVSGHEEQILGKPLTYNQQLFDLYPNVSNREECLQHADCANDWAGNAEYREDLAGLLAFLPTSCDQSSGPTARRRCGGLISNKVRVNDAKDQGQFGLSLKYFMENGDEMGLYFVNYHEKIPNFILPIDAIEDFSPVIDVLVRVADADCYFDGICDGVPGSDPLAAQGGFSGINDLSDKLSMKQINALLLFLSALPEDSGTVGSITFDLVRNPDVIFGDDNDHLFAQMGQAVANDPLLSAVATAFSMGAAGFILPGIGDFNLNTPVRSLNYRLDYAEDVRMLGFTYSTIFGTANVATELTYRHNTPMLSADVPRTPQRTKLFNWHINMLQVFEPFELFGIRLWDFSSFVAEALIWHVPNKLPYDANDTTNPDRLAVQNSPEGLGVSFFWGLEYHNVFTGWDAMVPIYMNWGVDGAMFNSGYREGQVIFATGISFNHTSGVELGMGITTFFGDQDDVFQMLTQDRNNMTAHFKYNF